MTDEGSTLFLVAHVRILEDGDTLGVLAGEEVLEFVREGDDGALLKAYHGAVATAVAGGVALDGEVEREVAAEIAGRVGVRKDASGNLIVAWFPWSGDGDEDDDFAETLASLYKGPGAVAKEDLHVTILYLGNPDAYDVDLVNALVKIQSTQWSDLQGVVGGVGRFVLDGDQDVLVALIDCPQLNTLRSCLRESISCYGACTDYSLADVIVEEHGFLPHATLGYVSKGQGNVPALSEVIPFCLCSLTVAAGPVRSRFDMPEYDMAPTESDYSPYVRAREALGDAVVFAKAGRVLSGKNLQALRDAHAAMGKVIDAEESRASGAENSLGGETRVEDCEGDMMKAGDLAYTITKATEEDGWHYTFGPLYAPNMKDAHGEYTDADTLQKAVHDYVQACVDAGDNRLNIQHDDTGDGAGAAGRWVEVCAWPYETSVTLKSVDGDREVKLPANTIYMGVKWEDAAYELVKSGKLQGLSMGGKAIRVVGDSGLPDMGAGLTKKIDDLAARADAPVVKETGLDTLTTTVLAGITGRLIDVLEKQAENGAVVINENGLGALIENDSG